MSWFSNKKAEPVAVKPAIRIPNNLDEAVGELHAAFTENEKREFANFSSLDPAFLYI
jgi:hypothetical protein